MEVVLLIAFLCLRVTKALHVPNVNASFGESPAPFTLKVEESFIEDLHRRVKDARAPIGIADLAPLDADGAPVAEFKQFTTTVRTPDSKYTHPVGLHFVHHRSPRKDAIPLLFIHGWPGSFLEVEKLLEPLTHPRKSSQPAFHVVAPSVPGYGFSPAPDHPGYGPVEAAHSFNALMLQLGYDKYVLQGGDLGGIILRYQTALFPSNVISALCNFWLVQPNADDLSRHATKEASADEKAYMDIISRYKTQDSGYRLMQQTQPLTLAYALTDSPMGFTMWIYAPMRVAVDPSSPPFTPAEVITWSMMHLIPGPYGGFRMYKGMSAEGSLDTLEFGSYAFVQRPVAISEFPYDLWYRLPLEWAKREGNVQRRFLHKRGGHFAAWEVPELLVEDIREWFGSEEGGFERVVEREL